MQSIDFVKTGISLVYIINLSKVRFSSSFCYIYSYLSNPYVYYEKTWQGNDYNFKKKFSTRTEK